MCKVALILLFLTITQVHLTNKFTTIIGDYLLQMADLQAHIEGIYGKATVDMDNGETLLLEPGQLT